jgi:hypothetical protein
VRQTESGRWVPDKPDKPAEPSAYEEHLASLQALARQCIADGMEMPWWYPLFSFEAAVGRDTLRRQ